MLIFTVSLKQVEAHHRGKNFLLKCNFNYTKGKIEYKEDFSNKCQFLIFGTSYE